MRALIVHKTPEFANVVSTVLDYRGIESDHIRTIPAGMEAVRGETPYDLILTHNRYHALDGPHGIEIMDECLERGIPAIMLTNDSPTLQKVQERGQVGIEQPMSLASLNAALDQALETGPKQTMKPDASPAAGGPSLEA